MSSTMEIDSPTSAAPQAPGSPKIDEGLYSRQLYVLGHDAMKRMGKSNVLIVGLKGLGVEIAKNVALAGVKSLSLYDPHPVEIADLSSQFFLREEDVGPEKPSRAVVSASRLAELNQYVPISVLEGELTEQLISKFQVVVLTDSGIELQVKINEYARRNGIQFISAETHGLFGSLFVDFGDSFTVVDATGEDPLQGIVSAIESDGTVAALDETRHGLQDGDYVKFTEVEGLALNDGVPRKVSVTGPYTFNIGDISNLGTYAKGGIFTQVQVPEEIHFSSLTEQLASPSFLISDFAKISRPAQIHIGFLALHAFANKHGGQLPRSYNQEDANEVLHLAKSVQTQYPDVLEGSDLDSDLIQQISFQSRGDISPMAAFFGGLTAQEVLKACSGKFSPVRQFFYFDSLESLPTDITLTEADTAPLNSRYDGQIAVFGKQFVDQIQNSKVFLVGSGAIGCEMLKNWALMGLGTGPDGKIIVTDNDSIEKSNLNRQFLFRPKDVGNQKSQVAAEAVIAMNPNLRGHIEAKEDKVGPETENIFNDNFWQSLDFVTNALDNVDARAYVDRRCILYRKPLLESGTLGTKGNVQVVYPGVTESYTSSQDPPEKSIPLCTLRSFPNKIDHTIAWAKSLFQGYFADSCENVNLYLSQPNFIESTLRQSGDQKGILETIQSYLVTDRPLTFEQCIVWARKEFEAKFNNDIQQLLYNFPKDAVTTTGTPFWSGPKRAPDPLKFDIKNEDHINFIIAAANLHAFNYGLKGDTDISVYRKVLSSLEVPEFHPSSSVKIQANDNEPDPNAELALDQDELSKLADSLPPPSSLAGFRLVPVEFEKDDDANHHIDFITAASNLRALNYGIERADRHKTKFVAGRIIPAIATTTALVTGLVCLELVKIVDGHKKIEDFKNGFINLALPFFGFSEPIASAKLKYNNKTFDKIWDRFDIYDKDLTLEQLIKKFKEEEGLTLTMLSSGTTLLYAQFYPAKKLKERLPLKLTDLIETVSKKPVPFHEKTIIFDFCADDENDEDVEIPVIILHL